MTQDDQNTAVGIPPPSVAEGKEPPTTASSGTPDTRDQIIVDWDGPDDPENPHNWSKAYRWFLTLVMGVLTLNSSFTSSLPSGTALESMMYFHVSQEVITLAITAYVIGFALGPLIWAPLSEHAGRWPSFVIALTCYTGFNVGCALSPNIGALIVFRLLAGSFSACPLTNSAAVLGDIWDANMRGTAMAVFALAPFAGPALGPLISGAISVTHTNWRWTYWVAAMFSGVCSLLAFVSVKETYAPVILARKARRMRKQKNDQRYVAPLELNRVAPRDFAKKTLMRPFTMLLQEPMLLAITLYTSFIYGVLYMLFEAFPLTFGELHGLNNLLSGACFLPFFVGGALSCMVYVTVVNPKYMKDAKNPSKSKYGMLPPEARLPITYIGAPCVTISAFWIAWTSYKSISIWCPLIATAVLGFGFIWIFQGLFNYIIDAYLLAAATAMAANTVVRSCFGAAFPLFTTQMFHRLGLHWGYTLVGFISLLLTPIPAVLGYYGVKLRSMSKNSMSIEDVLQANGIDTSKTEKTDEEAAPSANQEGEAETRSATHDEHDQSRLSHATAATSPGPQDRIASQMSDKQQW